MINVIHGGNVGSFNLLSLPNQNPINQQYIQSQLSNFSHSLTELGRKFMETSQEIYERVNSSEAMRQARAAIRNVRSMFDPNEIYYVDNLERMRTAQPMMQRFIMAEPLLRDLFHRQQCDGYSSTYIDVDPGRIGDQHYDWRRVMTGIIQEEVDEDGIDTWVARNFYEDLRPEDRDLTIEEKSAVLSTWEMVKLFTEANQDPTDIFGS